MKLFNTNEKKYNLFIILSSFAYGMAEIYVPIVLYNKDYSLKYIFIYFALKYAITLVNFTFVFKLGRLIKFRWILVISALTLGLNFYLLSIIDGSLWLLLITAIVAAIFTQTYWVSRHYYAIEVLAKQRMAHEVGNIIIFSQIAIIPSAFLGALAIEKFGLIGLTIIISAIVLISLIPIFFINEKKEYRSLSILETFKLIPKSSIGVIILDQFRLAIVTLFPLYIFWYIANTYRYIGELNMAIGIASSLFIYFFSHRMSATKNDYLHLSVFLLGIVFLIKLNTISAKMMMVVAILEGLFSRMQLTSFTKNLYVLGKNYDASSYLMVYEIVTNIASTLIYIVGLLFFSSNLKTFLYLIIFLFMLTIFVNFKDQKEDL